MHLTCRNDGDNVAAGPSSRGVRASVRTVCITQPGSARTRLTVFDVVERYRHTPKLFGQPSEPQTNSVGSSTSRSPLESTITKARCAVARGELGRYDVTSLHTVHGVMVLRTRTRGGDDGDDHTPPLSALPVR
jgi:hypothetical protein